MGKCSRVSRRNPRWWKARRVDRCAHAPRPDVAGRSARRGIRARAGRRPVAIISTSAAGKFAPIIEGKSIHAGKRGLISMSTYSPRASSSIASISNGPRQRNSRMRRWHISVRRLSEMVIPPRPLPLSLTIVLRMQHKPMMPPSPSARPSALNSGPVNAALEHRRRAPFREQLRHGARQFHLTFDVFGVVILALHHERIAELSRGPSRAGDAVNGVSLRVRDLACAGQGAELALRPLREGRLVRQASSQSALGEFLFEMDEQLDFRVQRGNENVHRRLRENRVQALQKSLRAIGGIGHRERSRPGRLQRRCRFPWHRRSARR